MKYIKYFLILLLTIFTLTSCSNDIEKYQKQVKDELIEYLYSVETATTGPRFETNYEYAEEVIEDYSLKTTKRRHVKSNINDAKEVLDKIILPKEKSDEMLEVYFNENKYYLGQLYDGIYGYVIGVFGDAVVYMSNAGPDCEKTITILGYEFYSPSYFDIHVYYQEKFFYSMFYSYVEDEDYNYIVNNILSEEYVSLMQKMFYSWKKVIHDRIQNLKK